MSGQKQIKNKRYEMSSSMEETAVQALETHSLRIYPARVKYVLVYPNINKTTAATCTIASNLVNFFGDCDYIISASGDLWDNLTPDLREILMFHELLHIMPIQNEKTGEYTFKLREHDVMEFREIIETYGLNWLDAVKATFIESGDFKPEEIDVLSL